MRADTLQIDHQLLQQLQQDPRYAYAIEEKKPSLLSELFQSIERWLSANISVDGKPLRLILYGICALAVVAVVWWIVRYVQNRHSNNMKQQVTDLEEEEERNIYSVDFDSEIAQALAAGNYTRATRLLYLQTLKDLSNAGRIDWQPQKTPTQFTLEVKQEAFSNMTYHFLRIRYGGFEADKQLFESMTSLKNAVEKGGDA